ncbi:MAG: hypothetical protein J5606_01380 [Bacteroidales bacterium]|nr:hypothetical protein [Bacteroidales bacterium]
MKKQLFFSLVLAATFALSLSCCNGIETEENTDTLYSSSKPYTRWWWFSSEIDTNDVRDQLIWLKEHEFGGVEIAWIYPMGLDTNTPHPEFLSPEWATSVVFAKRIADSLGLGCDFTYGTLWPFSDLNLPDGDQTITYFDTIEEAKRSFTWDYPLVARILNHLDKEAFYRYAAKMNKGLSEAYKGKKSGLFVDSWEVETRYLWTKGFGETFAKEHGYDVEPYMQNKTLLDTENAEVFYDYMHTLSNYVLREFYAPFAENATKSGAFSRAQCGGAPTDLLTAFTLVDIPETEAILYEPCFSKIAASAATLGNKEAVTAETFTCAYGWTGLLYKNGRGQSPYQGKEQIADLKLICDALFANGTNQIIWHGFPYNKVGDTSNFFYTTCQISTYPQHNLTGDNLTEFNKYMTQVSKYMRKGKNYSDLAVYMPLEDAWMNGYYPDSMRKVKAFFWGQYEMRFINTPDAFKGMQPLWVNEHFLSSASYENGVLHCGAADFKALYSNVEYMELSALKEILRLAKSGLPVLLAVDPKEPGKNKHAEEYAQVLAELHQLPNVKNDASVLSSQPLIAGENLPDFWCRQDGETYYVFFANPMSKTIEYPLQYGYAFSDKGASMPITVNHHGKTENVTLNFKPNESLQLKIDKKGVQFIDLGFIPKKMNGYEENSL